jgi:twinkle protein
MQKTEDKREAIPTMYDISGSAHFRNKADAGITVWRDLSDSSQPSQVHIQKVRFAETGQLGMVEFTYDPATGRYAEVSVAYDGGNS